MKDWTIRQRVLGSFGVVLALMAAMGAAVLMQLGGIDHESEEIQKDSWPGVIVSTDLLTNALESYTLLQRHALTPERQKTEMKLEANQKQQEALLRKYESTAFSDEDKALLIAAKTAFGAYGQVLARVFKLEAAKLPAAISADLDPEFERVREALRALVQYNETRHGRSIQKVVQLSSRAWQSILAGVIAALAMASLCGYWLFRAVTKPLGRLVNILNVMRRGDFTERMTIERNDEFGVVAEGFNRMADELAALVGQVQKSGLQVTTSLTEVAATSKQQQATANEIAATTAEISATSKEIAATANELSNTVSEVSTVAEQTAVLAGDGQSGLSQMEETMHHVVEAAGSITGKLTVLSEKAGNINQVVTTITKVADQTNLLSLNAAIEAEKAGEHGRGFAVVATEIRRLADQTAVATYDIEQIVKEIQSAVSASVMGMDKFSEEVRRGMQEIHAVGGQLSQIIQQVQALAPRFEAVSEGMQAQSTGAEQITEALVQLNEAAQQTVESLRQSASAMDDLSQVALGLRGGVSRFKLQAGAV